MGSGGQGRGDVRFKVSRNQGDVRPLWDCLPYALRAERFRTIGEGWGSKGLSEILPLSSVS